MGDFLKNNKILSLIMDNLMIEHTEKLAHVMILINTLAV
jgi:hypothetical protein